MKLKTILVYSAMAALLGGSMAGVKAGSLLGPDLPLIGDAALASKLVKAGNTAAAAGNIREANMDYQQALAACFTYENATLGLARCVAAEGDFTTAATYYRSAVYGHFEDDNIDLLTEYILVLNQASQGQEGGQRGWQEPRTMRRTLSSWRSGWAALCSASLRRMRLCRHWTACLPRACVST